jgi:hypothetical protein
VYLVKNPAAFDKTPELGMGYHFGLVEGSKAKGGGEGVVVLNAQYALTSKDIMNAESFSRLLSMVGKDLGSDIKVTMMSAPLLAPERPIVPSEDVSLFEKSFGHLVSNLRRYETRSTLHASPPFPLMAIFGLSERSQGPPRWKFAAGHLCNE